MLKPETAVDNPMAPEHRCKDFDEDCADVPGFTPDGDRRTHLNCWLSEPGCGWCPFLQPPPRT